MKKSIAAVALLLVATVAPSAAAGPVEPKPGQAIRTTHTNVNVIEGGLGKNKTLDVGVSVFPGPPGNTYAVDYEIVGVSATRKKDFDALVGRGTLQLNNGKATIPIKIMGDAFDETNETIRIDLFYARCTGGGECDLDSGSNPPPGWVTIADDDGKPTTGPQITVRNGFADARTDDTCDVEVDLEYGYNKPVSLDYKTEDLEATHPDDYDKTEGRMTFSPGQIRKYIAVPIHSDRKASTRNDRFVVNFSNPSGGTLGEDSAQCRFFDGPQSSSGRR